MLRGIETCIIGFKINSLHWFLVVLVNFWEPPLLQQLDDELLEMKFKVQFFQLTSGKKVLVYQKVGNEYHLFSVLNFQCAAILNFMTSYGCHYRIQQYGQPYDETKIQNGSAREIQMRKWVVFMSKLSAQ